MAIKITDDCINCGACAPECPNSAIYEGAAEWTWAEGTTLTQVIAANNTKTNATVLQTPISDDRYYIVSGKCTECVGFHDEPQCVAVCPVSCCIKDPAHPESPEVLLKKHKNLHKI